MTSTSASIYCHAKLLCLQLCSSFDTSAEQNRNVVAFLESFVTEVPIPCRQIPSAEKALAMAVSMSLVQAPKRGTPTSITYTCHVTCTVDWLFCDLIGHPEFEIARVLGPRNASIDASPSFWVGSGHETSHKWEYRKCIIYCRHDICTCLMAMLSGSWKQPVIYMVPESQMPNASVIR